MEKIMPKSYKNSKEEQSEFLKKNAKITGRRVKLLLFVIGLLFLVLIGKLFQMQIMNKSFYEAQMASSNGTTTQIVQGALRGNIYDAKGRPLATTSAIQAVNYTRGNNVAASDMRTIATKLTDVLTPDTAITDLTQRDKIDFYLADPQNLQKIGDTLTPKETTDSNGNPLSAGALYALEVTKVSDSVLNFSAKDTFAAELFKEMNSTTTYSTTVIAQGNITPEQEAYISAHEGDLAGVSIGVTWNRNYAQNDLTPLLGTVTTSKQGIPAEDLDAYLKKGYQRNDHVGTAYLEKSYENILQGKKTISDINTDSNGNIMGTTLVQQGQKGGNLKLTIDLDFQNSVDNILRNEMNAMIADGYGDNANGAYAVVMDSKTGGVLAMSGIKRDPSTGEITNNTMGTFQDVFTPGSVVKPATLTAGWNAGAISGNQVLDDQPITLGGSSTIQSWFTNGLLPINVVQALEYSSNTYMVQVALKMLGQPYTPNMTVSDTNRVKVYNELRAAYAQYGLGTDTGFDVPGESIGLINPTNASSSDIANLLFEAFGQYDNYTPLQLATYATTLANNGTRLAPHLVEGIYTDKNNTGTLGQLAQTVQAKTMDQVNISSDNMSLLHEGMYQVVNGNDYVNGQLGATGYFMRQSQGANYSISAKTGTAETVAPNGAHVTVENVVAFAPTENPQIAIGVMVPNTTVKDGGFTSKIGQLITNDIVNLYGSTYKFK